MFYIMDMVEGRILWDATLPDYKPAQRAAIFDAKVSTFAALHNVDWKKAGLEGFGKEGDYIARQIHRWTKQYQMSETTKIPEMDKLIDWLPKNIPPGERTTIVHGDYRIDNMILHPTEAAAIARARLGLVHARRPARRLHLPPDVVGDAVLRSAAPLDRGRQDLKA